jgi:hypothetical protein
LKVHLHNLSRIKSQKRVTKQKESRFFLLLLHDDRRIRTHTSEKWFRIRILEAPKAYGSDGSGFGFGSATPVNFLAPGFGCESAFLIQI